MAEEEAELAGRRVSRQEWRLSLPVHLAETRREALDDARRGAAAYLLDYAEAITGRPRPVPGPGRQDRRADGGGGQLGGGHP